ncbi:MAG: hypothetical protein KC635_27385 [Myxococcales bacterium]|nr:hypothetical protein [Myxococcales bacterium]
MSHHVLAALAALAAATTPLAPACSTGSPADTSEATASPPEAATAATMPALTLSVAPLPDAEAQGYGPPRETLLTLAPDGAFTAGPTVHGRLGPAAMAEIARALAATRFAVGPPTEASRVCCILPSRAMTVALGDGRGVTWEEPCRDDSLDPSVLALLSLIWTRVADAVAPTSVAAGSDALVVLERGPVGGPLVPVLSLGADGLWRTGDGGSGQFIPYSVEQVTMHADTADWATDGRPAWLDARPDGCSPSYDQVLRVTSPGRGSAAWLGACGPPPLHRLGLLVEDLACLTKRPDLVGVRCSY